MDFRQIEVYIKVVEVAGFSKAANELHISQPSVSSYIKSIENELGVVLINRSTKVLSTTLAGERFLEQAKKMVALMRETKDKINSLSEDISGEIRILASSVPAQYILPGLLAEFHKQYPGISFVLNQVDTSGVVHGVAAHKADIGFAGSIIAEKKCEFVDFDIERLVFIAPNNGCFYGDKVYSLEELLYSNSFISREYGSGTRMQYEKYFSENEIELDKIKTCASMDSTQSILLAVASGLGISIISELAAGPMIEQNKLLKIKLKNKMPERKIYAVFNKNIFQSHLVKLFIDYHNTVYSHTSLCENHDL